MTAHRAVVEVGPGGIRRLCCDTDTVDGQTPEMFSAALDAIDDAVALVNERPVAVDSLWRATLRSLQRGHSDGVLVLHPSWWPASRVAVVRAGSDTDEIVLLPRSWLLRQASPDASVVVEIAYQMVVVAGAEVVAIPRRTGCHPLVDEVAGAITGMTPAGAVLIDAPGTVTGAPALMRAVTGALRGGGLTVVEIDDARLVGLARAAQPAREEPAAPAGPSSPEPRPRARRLARLTAVSVVLAIPTMAALGRHGTPTPQISAPIAPTAFLLEGRMALTVPASWPTQRVLAGPGSARVQITSPSDPEVALHITQTPVAGEMLADTAERLKRAIDVEPAGVFVDFNPAGSSAGRPAVTYREVRAGHQVQWSVVLDGGLRISVGCQSRPGGDAAVREVCERAVRSAHAVG
jgi:type VII secretion-associated protein (TIGR03931 family)